MILCFIYRWISFFFLHLDFAVGAPYIDDEQKGAVYIYLGGKDRTSLYDQVCSFLVEHSSFGYQ